MNSTERCGRSLLSNAAVKRPARSPVIIYTAAELHKHCAPGGIRTPNLLIRSQMLYPLSYGRLSRSRATREQTTGAPSPREIAGRALLETRGPPQPRHKARKRHQQNDLHFRRYCKNFQ